MDRRSGAAGFGRPLVVDAHYSMDVDFLEAARGAKKHITMPRRKTLNAIIPEGLEEGQQLRLKGPRQQPIGDAYVKLHIRLVSP